MINVTLILMLYKTVLSLGEQVKSSIPLRHLSRVQSIPEVLTRPSRNFQNKYLRMPLLQNDGEMRKNAVLSNK